MTPEIARRLRAGEEVSPEEIAEAQAAAAAVAEGAAASSGGQEDAGRAAGKGESEDAADDGNENEWLPEGLRKEGKGGTRGRKGKKRR